jgi:hypothetical protein
MIIKHEGSARALRKECQERGGEGSGPGIYLQALQCPDPISIKEFKHRGYNFRVVYYQIHQIFAEYLSQLGH